MSLHSEMNASVFAVKQAHLDRLRGLGVSTATIAAMGAEVAPFGVVAAEPVGNGLYQPGHGAAYIQLPVWENGALVDLVAFRSTAPDDWLLRKGVGWALGLNDGLSGYVHVEKGFWENAAHLFSNPLDWLRGGGQGVCVLDWSCPEITRLDMLARVTVSDLATGKLLEQALRRPVRIPKIELMRVADVA